MIELKYGLSAHATEQVLERFGISPQYAPQYLNYLLLGAVEADRQNPDSPSTILENREHSIRIIIDESTKTVITVYDHEDKKKMDAAFSEFDYIHALKDAFHRYVYELQNELFPLQQKEMELNHEIARLKHELINLPKGGEQQQLSIQKQISMNVLEVCPLTRRVHVLTKKIEAAKKETEAALRTRLDVV